MSDIIIHASAIHSPVGKIVILGTGTCITAVTFREVNISGLTENAITAVAADELQRYFDGSLKQFTFPIAQKGTDFQRSVWERLLDIPYGETISYAKFSADQPLAIRAMAAANGKNNIAIAVPCHRVIGSNGKLIGYAGGLWRKQWLLDHEREVAQVGQAVLRF